MVTSPVTSGGTAPRSFRVRSPTSETLEQKQQKLKKQQQQQQQQQLQLQQQPLNNIMTGGGEFVPPSVAPPPSLLPSTDLHNDSDESPIPSPARRHKSPGRRATHKASSSAEKKSGVLTPSKSDPQHQRSKKKHHRRPSNSNPHGSLHNKNGSGVGSRAIPPPSFPFTMESNIPKTSSGGVDNGNLLRETVEDIKDVAAAAGRIFETHLHKFTNQTGQSQQQKQPSRGQQPQQQYSNDENTDNQNTTTTGGGGNNTAVMDSPTRKAQEEFKLKSAAAVAKAVRLVEETASQHFSFQKASPSHYYGTEQRGDTSYDSFVVSPSRRSSRKRNGENGYAIQDILLSPFTACSNIPKDAVPHVVLPSSSEAASLTAQLASCRIGGNSLHRSTGSNGSHTMTSSHFERSYNSITEGHNHYYQCGTTGSVGTGGGGPHVDVNCHGDHHSLDYTMGGDESLNTQDHEELLQMQRLGSWDTIGTQGTAFSLNSGTTEGSSLTNKDVGSFQDDDGNKIDPLLLEKVEQRREQRRSQQQLQSGGLTPCSKKSGKKNFTKSSSSTRQKVVKFDYPPVSSLRACPRHDEDDLPNLFFTEEELEQIEEDRYNTQIADDVEIIAVASPLSNDDDDFPEDNGGGGSDLNQTPSSDSSKGLKGMFPRSKGSFSKNFPSSKIRGRNSRLSPPPSPIQTDSESSGERHLQQGSGSHEDNHENTKVDKYQVATDRSSRIKSRTGTPRKDKRLVKGVQIYLRERSHG
mmetsp:Transcript_21370/g.30226  ORF Transcript_21370/g.30226 Transcript_21370/m.30226 type:complete len:747 (+) Transcript_21370:25-2265(+)